MLPVSIEMFRKTERVYIVKVHTVCVAHCAHIVLSVQKLQEQCLGLSTRLMPEMDNNIYNRNLDLIIGNKI